MTLHRAATLLHRRDRLVRGIARLNAQLDDERRAWSFAQGYCVPVRSEQFQQEIRNAR